jgi:hypothetical protein
MAKLTVGERFPAATLQDIDGVAIDFPVVFKNAPATVFFSTAAAGDLGAGPR